MIYILYGSQTGQAKSISDSLYDRIDSTNNSVKIFELDEIDKSYQLTNISIAIIICSTTGDGDAPENASKFLRLIKAYSKPLVHLKYSVLGLGDTNYTNFCNASKKINERLLKLGAKQFYPSAWADDAVGLETVVDPWLDGVCDALKLVNLKDIENGINNINFNTKEIINAKPSIKENQSSAVLLGDHLVGELKTKNLSIPLLQPAFLEIKYNEDSSVDYYKPLISNAPLPSINSDLIYAKVENFEKICKKYAIKNVYKIKLGHKDCDWQWLPGDSVGILPRNSYQEVEKILDRLKIPENKRNCPIIFSILKDTEKRRPIVPEHLVSSNNISIRSALLWLCDIRQPISKIGLRILAEYCSEDSDEKRRILELCSKEGQIFYTRCLREPSLPLLDLLNWFPNCEVPIERIFEFIPRLKPRAYSLCSLDTISFAFSHVDIAPQQMFRTRPLTGVCTTWMQNLPNEHETEVPVYLRKNLNGFTISDYNKEPYILIGPGTGVAPFVAFLEYFDTLKQSGQELGPIWLFYGCRHKTRDYLFEEELQKYVKNKTLTHLCVAYSRETESSVPLISTSSTCDVPGKYVQDCLRIHGSELIDLVTNCGENFRIFVCGDASNMSKDVLKTWIDVLYEHSTKNSIVSTMKEAEGLVAKWRLTKLYMEDVWL